MSAGDEDREQHSPRGRGAPSPVRHGAVGQTGDARAGVTESLRKPCIPTVQQSTAPDPSIGQLPVVPTRTLAHAARRLGQQRQCRSEQVVLAQLDEAVVKHRRQLRRTRGPRDKDWTGNACEREGEEKVRGD